MPNHIFISGMHVPGLENEKDKKKIHLLEGDEFINEIMGMGGTNEEVFDHPELADYFIPIIKNDLKIVHCYRSKQKVNPPLNCGFSVFTGEEEEYSTEQIMGWDKYTTATCEFYKLNRGHFFINEETEKIISIIIQTLKMSKILQP